MIKIAVFDLDGTLVNSLVDLAQSVNKGLKKAGLATHSIKKFNQFVGNGREVLIKNAMGECADDKRLFDLVESTFNSEYALHCNDNTMAYDGCAELLKRLDEHRIMTAVLSNKPDEFVSEIVKKVYPDHSFSQAWGQKPQYKRKPSGEALLAMLDLCNVKIDECIYIGDSDVDVFTAQNAGVKMAGVAWGFRGREELLVTGAPVVAETADELFEYIMSL